MVEKQLTCATCGRTILHKGNGNCLWCNKKLKKERENETLINKISTLIKERKNKKRVDLVNLQLQDDFFRRTIYNKYCNKCAFCKSDGKEYKTTKNGHKRKNYLSIHHKSYNWKCPFYGESAISCNNCSKCHPELFKNCLNNCILLCDTCHFELHLELKHTNKGNWLKI